MFCTVYSVQCTQLLYDPHPHPHHALVHGWRGWTLENVNLNSHTMDKNLSTTLSIHNNCKLNECFYHHILTITNNNDYIYIFLTLNKIALICTVATNFVLKKKETFIMCLHTQQLTYYFL